MLKNYLPYILLLGAIITEVMATSLLKDTNQFKRWDIVLWMIGLYSVSFYLLSIVVQSIPIGITYAIWSGLGIVLIILLGIYKYQQTPNIPTIIGLALIIAGVVLVNLTRESH